MIALLIIAAVLAIGAGIYARIFFRRYVHERQERARAVALFSRYVAPQVVDELLARKDPRLFEAREYYATILCVRARNFALFVEKLSPEETLRYLNEFYTVVGQAVQRHHGMIESFRGDTVTAIFGVLVEEKFQEERALRAALDVMRIMKAMEARWQAQGRRPFSIGIGVNSGKIVAGDTGFQQRREFAIIGNPAHVAARLEAASEELNASIIASDTTYDVVRDLFVAVPTSSMPLRGLRHLQNAYVIRGLSSRAPVEDTLRMPSSRAFRKTNIRSYDVDEATVEPDVYIAPKEPQPERSRVDAGPIEVHFVDERVNTMGAPKHTRFSAFDDERPALPDLPPIEGIYEDDDGPPIQLSP